MSAPSERPFRPTARTALHRHPERGAFDRDTVYRILDEGLVGHVGFVDGGVPCVTPTLYARVHDTLYLHGSVSSRTLTALGAGAEACVTVTLLDGLVLARSAFAHSMNYRSVVMFGRGRRVDDAHEKMGALRATVEHVAPGRWDDVRQPTRQELDATLVAALALDEVSAKVRSGPPKDRPDDLDWPTWAGVVPLALVPGTPEDDPGLPPGTPRPAYVRRYRR